MKRVLTAAVCVLLAAMQVQAQEPAHPGKTGPGKHKDRPGYGKGMEFRDLNLTEEQKAKFKTQQESFRKEMEALRKNEDITVRESKSRKEALVKKHKESMQNILTTEQKAKLEKQKQDRMAMHEVNAKARMEKMKIRLGLSNEQVNRLEKQRADMRTQVKAIHENKQLSRDEKHEQMKELMKKQKETMDKVLTPEQKAKLKEMKPRQERGAGGRKHFRGKSAGPADKEPV